MEGAINEYEAHIDLDMDRYSGHCIGVSDMIDIDGLVQDYSSSIANALEVL